MKSFFSHTLVCPVCKQHLILKQTSCLYCKTCRIRYSVIYGIPVLINLASVPIHIQKQIQYFKSEVKTFNSNHILEPWQEKYVERLLRHTGTLENKVVVDDACGSGYIAIEAAKRGAKTIACDVNLDGLIRIQKLSKKLGINKNLLLVCCSSELLPLRSNCADIIVANAILEHLQKEKQAIHEIHRIAKKKAIAYITVPIAYHLLNPIFLFVNFIHDKSIGHLRRYTKETLLERFSGWKTVGVYYSGHTVKVFKTILNQLFPFFSEKKMEEEDEQYIANKYFSSNISIVFKKNT